MSGAASAHALALDPGYTPLKQHLIDSTGLSYYADKDDDLATRIAARLAHLGIDGCRAYLALVKDPSAGEAERHVLIGQLTIGETYFFRHTEQFDGLRDVALPDLIERNRDRRTLRIWSAGCAIGAEPYSIAILLKQCFGDRLAGWDVRILGTDINQSFLARAERGEFDERALRSAPDDFKREWFSPTGRSWTIRPFVKDWVSFQYHNLVEHPYPSIVHGIAAMDLILCRNVMIYFDWETIGRILGRFHDCLVDGGWLAVGHAESNTEVFRGYRTVNVPGATLYQKSDDRGTPSASAWPAPPAARAEIPQGMLSFADQPWSPPVLPPMPDAPRARVEHHAIPSVPTPLAHVRQLADEGNWDAAAAASAQLLEQDQLNPIVHFYHALIMEQLKRHLDAEQALRRAIYLNRGHVLAHYHLALMLDRTDRRDGAIVSIRNVQRLLAKMDASEPIADADGLTAGDLAELARMHLELWQ